MTQATFLVEDLFSLVDLGVAISGYVQDGQVTPDMVLQLPNRQVQIIRIEGHHDQQFDMLDQQISQSQPVSPSVIVGGIDKTELNQNGVYPGALITFVNTAQN